MFKRILAITLATLMLFAFAACSAGGNGKNPEIPTSGLIMRNEDSVELGTPDVTLNPKDVYAKLTYTPEMFYGIYQIFGGDAARDKFYEEAEYFTYNDGEEEKTLTKVPFMFRAGKHSFTYTLKDVTEYNWMDVYFGSKFESGDVYLDNIICAYTVEGKTLKLRPLKHFETDTENNKIIYEFADAVWEYEFEFNGRELTFKNDGASVTLTTCLDAYGEEDYFHIDAYLSEGSQRHEVIDQITLFGGNENFGPYVYFDDYTGETYSDAIAKYEDNGLLTFTIPFEDGIKTYQYVMFYCDDDGIIITDGDNTYYYNDDYSDRNYREVSKYTSEDMTGKLKELSEDEIEALVEKQEDLMSDLAAAFNDAGIAVTVDELNGEIRMDSSILFGSDSAYLTDEGKTFLNKFIGVYSSIILSEKYNGFVNKTMVEGHTAPLANSTYETGLPLSVERANVVKNYCLSPETGVDTSALAPTMEAVGMSNVKPIKDASGNVDLDASRRVSFRFTINI